MHPKFADRTTFVHGLRLRRRQINPRLLSDACLNLFIPGWYSAYTALRGRGDPSRERANAYSNFPDYDSPAMRVRLKRRTLPYVEPHHIWSNSYFELDLHCMCMLSTHTTVNCEASIWTEHESLSTGDLTVKQSLYDQALRKESL